jgi:hypothetical protein
MLYVVFAVIGLAFLVMSFLGFAFPDRYARITHYTQAEPYRRLAVRRQRKWPYRISNLLLFLMLLFCATRLVWLFGHR